jgi:hypothetical protein
MARRIPPFKVYPQAETVPQVDLSLQGHRLCTNIHTGSCVIEFPCSPQGE